MFSIIVRSANGYKKITSLGEARSIDKNNIVWVDLINFDKDEELFFSKLFDLQLQYSEAKSEEIETSSRYFEVGNVVYANSNFLYHFKDDIHLEPITFIFYEDTLITVHDNDQRIFADMIRRLQSNTSRHTQNGWHIFMNSMEARIDADADIIEHVAKYITVLNKSNDMGSMDTEVLVKVNKYQELAMVLRENITDRQRMFSTFLKNQDAPNDVLERIRIALNDINSLLSHIQFSFERLEFLQNTILGLVNIEQNKIIKLFTVASVVFMPPTLIASIYGMNFKLLPELDWRLGYPFAILLMVASSSITLLYFKFKKWL